MVELLHENPPYPQVEVPGEIPLSERVGTFSGRTHDQVVAESTLVMRPGHNSRLAKTIIDQRKARMKGLLPNIFVDDTDV
jgi:hypothetical protein